MKEDFAKFLLEKTKKDYNLIGEYFSSKRRAPWKELKFLFEKVKEKEKVLDLGCGNGRFYEFLKEKNVDYYGIDSAPSLIKIAKSFYPQAKFQVGDALNLPFKNNFFDKIFSIALFHHIPSKKFRIHFLKETKRVLKKKGFFILTVWNLRESKKGRLLLLKYTILKLLGLSRLDFGDIFCPFKDEKGKILFQRYIHCFTKRELKKLLKLVAFKIEKIGIVGKGIQSNIFCICQKI